MDDVLYLVVILAFFLASFGLMGVIDRLGRAKR